MLAENHYLKIDARKDMHPPRVKYIKDKQSLEQHADNILDFINFLVEELGYSEEDAETAANAMFSDDFSDED